MRVSCNTAALKNSSPEFDARVLARILQEQLGVPAGAGLRLAFSGGMDSLVLLHALAAIKDRYRWELRAVHVDHGLHPDSAAWARDCRRRCEELGVPCHVEAVQVRSRSGEGMEAAARRARYACLDRYLEPGQFLLTAHHRRDQAETLLLHLLRGTGLPGLAAMGRDTPFGRGRLLRPLLQVDRAALRAYARRHGLRWLEDPGNADTRIARNYLRHRVLPPLRQRWPELDRQLARFAENAADAVHILDQVAAADLAACRTEAGDPLSVVHLAQLEDERLRNLLRYWIRQAGFLPPARRHLQQLVHMVRTPTRTRHGLLRWPGAEVRRYRDRLFLMAPLAPVAADWALSWEPPAALNLPGTGLVLSARPSVGEGLALSRLDGRRLCVRPRLGGERLRLPGRAHRQKLKKLLQEQGVPPWERRRLPLIYAGEELVAVGDRWVCQPWAARGGEPGLKLCLHARPVP